MKGHGLIYNEKDSNVLVEVIHSLEIFINGIHYALIIIGMLESVGRNIHTLTNSTPVVSEQKQVTCSCGYKFKPDEVDELETCPKCKKSFCYKCGDSITPIHIFHYGYNGNEYSCGNCGECFS